MPRPEPRTTYKYSDRFKATAVRLSRLPGVSVRKSPFALHPSLHVVSLAQTSARGKDRDERCSGGQGRGSGAERVAPGEAGDERLKLEHEILKKSHRVHFQSKSRDLRLHRALSSDVLGASDVSAVQGECERLLRLAGSARAV